MPQITNIAARLGLGASIVRYTYTWTDLAAIAGSGAQTSTIKALIAAHGILLGVRVINKTNFAGGALSALTLSVGKTASATFFTAAYDLFATSSDTTVQETSLFKHGQLTALDVLLTWTPTSDTLANITSGQVDIDFYILNPSTDMTAVP
jgi:hypothetical protein